MGWGGHFAPSPLPEKPYKYVLSIDAISPST